MERYLTVTHAGVRLGLSPFRVAQLFDRGDLRGIRDSNGRRLIEEDSVEELRAKRAKRPVARSARNTQNSVG